jgi:hypothetical protein
MTQSTRSTPIRDLRMLPLPEVLEDMDLLVRTNPTMPFGAGWWTKCCAEVKLALPQGWAWCNPCWFYHRWWLPTRLVESW